MQRPPIIPQCETYLGKTGTWPRAQCPSKAVGCLRAPGGFNTGAICGEHARKCITEFAELLGETWTLDRWEEVEP